MFVGRATVVCGRLFPIIVSRHMQISYATIRTFKECSGSKIHKLTSRFLNTKPNLPINYRQDHINKNILIYRCDNFMFFRLVGLFAMGQLVFWSYLTYSAYTNMSDSRMYELIKYGPEGAPPEVKNWHTMSGIRMKLHSGLWRYAITSLCIIVGGIIFTGALTYSKKCIHRIVLRKGGDRITFSTFGFFSIPWSFTVPLSKVSCQHSRHGVRMQVPIKVKGHRFFYLMDKEGRLYNAPLFDQTVGMRRMFVG